MKIQDELEAAINDMIMEGSKPVEIKLRQDYYNRLVDEVEKAQEARGKRTMDRPEISGFQSQVGVVLITVSDELGDWTCYKIISE